MVRRKYHNLYACQSSQSSRDGDKTLRASTSRATFLSSTNHVVAFPSTNRFDCSDADWNRYLTQGWDNVVWNKDPEAWAEALEQAGCGRVELPEPRMGDLDIQVHPIFARLNWVQAMSNDLWEVLLPSLRLASKLLLSQPAMAFFRQIQFGIEQKTVSGRTYLHYVKPRDPNIQDSEVRSSLDALGSRLQLLFAATPSKISSCQIHAAHCVSHYHFGRDYFIRGDVSSLPEDDGQFQYLLINQAYADYLTTYARKRVKGEDTSASDFVRATFCLASSLVHEVGHAFYARNRMDINENYDEPFFDLAQHDAEPELGHALEYAIFGVSITACIHPEHGVALEWQPIVKQQVGDSVAVIDENYLNYPIDPRWMHGLLTKNFWHRVENAPYEEQLRPLMVPTNVSHGATLDPKTRNWVWRTRKTDLTRFGTNLNRAALAKKVKLLKQREVRIVKPRIVRVTTGKHTTRAKRDDSRKTALLEISVAAGEPIA